MVFGAAAVPLFAAVTPEALAQRCPGVQMPKRVVIDSRVLQLAGIGVRLAVPFRLDVYAAGLYLERRTSQASAILAADTMKHVRLRFVRDVRRQDVARELRTRFREAAGKKYPKLKARFDRFVSWLPALHSGDTLAATYRPGDGLEIRLEGKTLGSVPGAEFSRALFSLWISSLMLAD